MSLVQVVTVKVTGGAAMSGNRDVPGALRRFNVNRGSYLQLGTRCEWSDVAVKLPGLGLVALTMGTPIGPIPQDGVAEIFPFAMALPTTEGGSFDNSSGLFQVSGTTNGPRLEVFVYDCEPLPIARRARCVRSYVGAITTSEVAYVEIPWAGRKRGRVTLTGDPTGESPIAITFGFYQLAYRRTAQLIDYGPADYPGASTLNQPTELLIGSTGDNIVAITGGDSSVTIVDEECDSIVITAASASGTPTCGIHAVCVDE